ncbi:MAG: nitroreductase family protein [Simkaniaceae bacterium]|nr:nitroreductase family protein [Simkaniaceae bacterium]
MRRPDHPIQSLIVNRWSPRAMSGEKIKDEQLMSLFEAARWAPSAYNAQPWRFIFAKRETKHWKPLFELLIEFNQTWAKDAAVLVLVISRKVFEQNGKPLDTHSFDTGAAWENLALEGSAQGLVIHGMQGFDYEKAKIVCGVPDEFQVEAMIAIGKPGKKKNLPPEIQKRETPSTRKPLKELIMEGKYF